LPASTPRAIALIEPPASWMKKDYGLLRRQLPGHLGDVSRLTRLAAEADDQRGADVGVGRRAGQHPLGHGHIVADLRAAVGMGHCYRARNERGHALRHGIGADHRRDDQQVVTDADGAVRPPVAPKVGGLVSIWHNAVPAPSAQA